MPSKEFGLHAPRVLEVVLRSRRCIRQRMRLGCSQVAVHRHQVAVRSLAPQHRKERELRTWEELDTQQAPGPAGFALQPCGPAPTEK